MRLYIGAYILLSAKFNTPSQNARPNNAQPTRKIATIVIGSILLLILIISYTELYFVFMADKK